MKKGTKYGCKSCGVVLVVDTSCDCTPCDVVCCGVPMEEVKAKAKLKAKKELSGL